MKLSQCGFALAVLFSAAAVYAEDVSFTGPSVSIGLGTSSNKVGYGSYLDGKSSSKTDVASDLQFNYGIAAGKSWVIGLGASYDLSNREFGSVGYVDNGQQTVDAKLKEHWSVFVAPGYLVQPDLLVYGKLAYHGAKGEYQDSGTDTGTRNHSGFGYGLGASYALNRAMSVSLEVQHVSLSRESAHLSTGKPSFTEGMIRLGYHF